MLCSRGDTLEPGYSANSVNPPAQLLRQFLAGPDWIGENCLLHPPLPAYTAQEKYIVSFVTSPLEELGISNPDNPQISKSSPVPPIFGGQEGRLTGIQYSSPIGLFCLFWVTDSEGACGKEWAPECVNPAS